MRLQKTIPQYVEDHDINSITVNLTTKRAEVQLVKGENLSPVMVDFSPVLSAASATELATLRRFFRWLMAQAYEVDETTLPEENVFEPNA